MSSSEESQNTSSSCSDDSSLFWDLGGFAAIAAAHLATATSTVRAPPKRPLPVEEVTGRQWVALNMERRSRCFDNFRMYPEAFQLLHDTLVARHGLQSTRECESMEALGMFIWACGTRQSYRQIRDRFRRSLDTVCRKFNEVLEAMYSWSHTMLRPKDRNYSSVHERLHRYSPYFDGCIGAMDETHIPVCVNKQVHDDFINRKGWTSQNVLAICDMDMRFTFVGTGMAGAAHDMAVLREAMENCPCFPHAPAGKFYLVDSGYAVRAGFLPPYRSCRYHLTEFQNKQPESLYEIFNYHHSSLRNIVERSFEVAKQKWRILQGIPFYPRDKHSKIIIACFALHNFVLEHNDGSNPARSICPNTGVAVSDWVLSSSANDMGNVRDWIANGLWSLMS